MCVVGCLGEELREKWVDTPAWCGATGGVQRIMEAKTPQSGFGDNDGEELRASNAVHTYTNSQYTARF